MLKKIAIACAGFVLVGQSAFAQVYTNPLDGVEQPQQQNVVPAPSPLFTYVGEIDGIPVVMQIKLHNGQANGTLIVGSDKCPLTGQLNGNAIEGTWQAASGKTYQFRATNNDGVVTLSTNGKTLTLRLPQNQTTNVKPANGLEPVINDVPTDGPADGPVDGPVSGPANNGHGEAFGHVGVKVGQFFSVPMPQGWKQMEGPGYTFVTDGKSGFGVMGVPLQAGEKLDTFATKALEMVGVRNPNVVSKQSLTVENGQGIVYVLSFAGSDGVKRTGIFKIVISNNGNQSMGMVTHAATPDDQFEKQIGKLAEFAMAIRVVPQQMQMPNTPANPAGDRDSVVESSIEEVSF